MIHFTHPDPFYAAIGLPDTFLQTNFQAAETAIRYLFDNFDNRAIFPSAVDDETNIWFWESRSNLRWFMWFVYYLHKESQYRSLPLPENNAHLLLSQNKDKLLKIEDNLPPDISRTPFPFPASLQDHPTFDALEPQYVRDVSATEPERLYRYMVRMITDDFVSPVVYSLRNPPDWFEEIRASVHKGNSNYLRKPKKKPIKK